MVDEQPSRWDTAREIGLAVLAVISVLIGFSRLVAVGGVSTLVKALDVLIAAAFAADWGYRALRSGRALRYLALHSWEVVMFIPYTLLPAAEGATLVRGARLLRALRVLRYGRFLRLTLGLARLPKRVRYLRRVVGHAQLVSLVILGVVLVAAGAAALLAVEGPVNPDLATYGQALWWSLNLFSTVAYGVPNPVTSGGYALASLLMVSGIGFVGLFTASLANALLKEPGVEAEDEP